MDFFEDLETLDESTTDFESEAADRRRAPRFAPARRVTVECTEGVMSVFGWGQTHLSPSLLDLSSGGARVATNESLRPGSVVRLDLESAGLDSVEAFGEVRWSRPAAGTGKYQAGIEFFTPPSDHSEALKLLLELLRRPDPA